MNDWADEEAQQLTGGHVRLVESLTRDLAEATKERDALRRQVHRLTCGEEIESDRLCEDALAAQETIDRLARERDELSASQEAACADMESALAERSRARHERDALYAQLERVREAWIRFDTTLVQAWGTESDPYAYAYGAVKLDLDAAIFTPAHLRCQCQWEAGDSPCRVHGEDESDTREPQPPSERLIASWPITTGKCAEGEGHGP